jgi:hypothetical protein
LISAGFSTAEKQCSFYGQSAFFYAAVAAFQRSESSTAGRKKKGTRGAAIKSLQF